MKTKINTSFSIKLLVTLLLTSTCVIFVSAQQRPQQNVRRVTVTSRYVFVNGKKTDKYQPIYQEMFDSLGRLHTEIEYDFIDQYPHRYILHSYKGKQRIKTETFKDNKLLTVESFTYDNDSYLIQKTLKKVNQSDTAIYILNYKYDFNKKPVEITAKTADGSVAYVSKSTFDNKGKELTRKVKVKKNFYPQDSILKLTCIPSYDSLGRLISERLTIDKVGKTNVIRGFKYSYDKENNQVLVVELDANGKQIHREEKGFQPRKNRISWIKYFDANDILVKMTGTRYDFYPTNDTRIRETDY